MGVKVDNIDDSNKKALKFAFNITDDSSSYNDLSEGTYIQSIYFARKNSIILWTTILLFISTKKYSSSI